MFDFTRIKRKNMGDTVLLTNNSQWFLRSDREVEKYRHVNDIREKRVSIRYLKNDPRVELICEVVESFQENPYYGKKTGIVLHRVQNEFNARKIAYIFLRAPGHD